MQTIKELKKELHIKAKNNSLTSTEVVKISQQLDKQILREMQRQIKKKKLKSLA
ncbi:MAG: aspartyl-phosphate phosphatase Spo0E family protein [Halanaerobiales bacterium]